MVDKASNAAPEALETQKKTFIEALKALPADSRLNAGNGVEYKNTAQPLVDSTVIFLEESGLNLEQEFKLVQVLIKKVFESTRMGLEIGGHKFYQERIEHVFNFIKLAQERYAGIAPEEFWHPYLHLTAAEAAKEIKTLQGISRVTNVATQEAALAMLEEINGLLPLPDIAQLRTGFTAMVHKTLLENAEHVYTAHPDNRPLRDIGVVMATANKHGLSLPTENEFWKSRAVTTLTELQNAIDALSKLIEADNFRGEYSEIIRNIERSERFFEKAAKLIPTIEFDGETKSIREFLQDLKEKANELEVKNESFKMDQEITKIAAAVEGLDTARVDLFTLRTIVNQLNHVKHRKSEQAAELKAKLLKKIGDWLDLLTDQMKADNSRTDEIAQIMLSIGELRRRI